MAPTYQPGYQAPTPSNGMATAALVLGIVSVALFWTFGLGVLLGILAVIFGMIGIRRAESSPHKVGRGQAIGGLVTGIVGVVSGIAFVVLMIAVGDDYNSDPSDGVCDDARFWQDPDC